jgi:uncharacterized protein YbjT (DUF2867 family)
MRAVIVGGTGLIGRGVIAELLAEPDCSQLLTISRRSQSPKHEKWREKVGSFSDLAALCAGIEADTAFCCLGTTMRQAGSQEAFAEIDRHLPFRFAKAMREQGVKNFHVVSSLGANAASHNFYLRTKGLMEQELSELGFDSLGIYRPSLLLGSREESRPLERISILGYRLIQPIYPRFLQTWQPIEARDVARMMVVHALHPSKGIRIFANSEMHKRRETF